MHSVCGFYAECDRIESSWMANTRVVHTTIYEIDMRCTRFLSARRLTDSSNRWRAASRGEADRDRRPAGVPLCRRKNRVAYNRRNSVFHGLTPRYYAKNHV